MTQNPITVIYKWIAKEGKLDALTQIYQDVTNQMQTTEPGATRVHVYASTAENALYIHDEFADAASLGFHLSQTAAAHFASLMEIATPGPFYFLGSVPEEMQQAATNMGLAAEFSSLSAGFSR